MDKATLKLELQTLRDQIEELSKKVNGVEAVTLDLDLVRVTQEIKIKEIKPIISIANTSFQELRLTVLEKNLKKILDALPVDTKLSDDGERVTLFSGNPDEEQVYDRQQYYQIIKDACTCEDDHPQPTENFLQYVRRGLLHTHTEIPNFDVCDGGMCFTLYENEQTKEKWQLDMDITPDNALVTLLQNVANNKPLTVGDTDHKLKVKLKCDKLNADDEEEEANDEEEEANDEEKEANDEEEVANDEKEEANDEEEEANDEEEEADNPSADDEEEEANDEEKETNDEEEEADNPSADDEEEEENDEEEEANDEEEEANNEEEEANNPSADDEEEEANDEEEETNDEEGEADNPSADDEEEEENDEEEEANDEEEEANDEEEEANNEEEEADNPSADGEEEEIDQNVVSNLLFISDELEIVISNFQVLVALVVVMRCYPKEWWKEMFWHAWLAVTIQLGLHDTEKDIYPCLWMKEVFEVERLLESPANVQLVLINDYTTPHKATGIAFHKIGDANSSVTGMMEHYRLDCSGNKPVEYCKNGLYMVNMIRYIPEGSKSGTRNDYYDAWAAYTLKVASLLSNEHKKTVLILMNKRYHDIHPMNTALSKVCTEKPVLVQHPAYVNDTDCYKKDREKVRQILQFFT